MKKNELPQSLDQGKLEQSTRIITTLSKIAYHYRRMLSMQSTNYDISPNEGGLMLLLYRYKDITTATQVAKEMGVTKSLVSRSVDNLTKNGYLTIQQDDLDRRVQHLILTEKAKEICDGIYEDSTNIYIQAIKRLGEDDLAVTERVLNIIAENFENI